MTVQKLIDLLIQCDPTAKVEFIHADDNPLCAWEVYGVIELKYHDEDTVDTVVLRGV